MFKKLVLLVLSSTLLVGCSQSKKTNPQKNVSYAETLKKAGDDIFDYAGANRGGTRSIGPEMALDPLVTEDKQMYLLMPAVLLYMTGSISEIGIDTENNLFEFGGDYEYKFGDGWTTQTIFLAINAKINSEQDNILFKGRERLYQNGSLIVTSDVFLDINFDFDKKEVKGFELYMEQMDDYAYVKAENGVGQIRKSTTQLTPEEAAKYDGTYQNLRAEFATAYENRVVSTEANNRACMEKFVETQLYQNQLIGQDLPVRIKE